MTVHYCSDYGYPEVGAIIVFYLQDDTSECFRVEEITDDTFLMVKLTTDADQGQEQIDFTEAYRRDLETYGDAGTYWKQAFANPVMGQNIIRIYNLDGSYFKSRITFVGTYTIELEDI